MNVKQYAYRVIWSEEDQEFVGLCAEFPGLSWLEEEQDAALRGIVRLVEETVRDMAANGESIPEPFSLRKYSGKFMVRTPCFPPKRASASTAISMPVLAHERPALRMGKSARRRPRRALFLWCCFRYTIVCCARSIERPFDVVRHGVHGGRRCPPPCKAAGRADGHRQPPRPAGPCGRRAGSAHRAIRKAATPQAA